MFIKLTSGETGETTRINVDRISAYYREGEVTILVFDSRTRGTATETPEEIDAKIERVTNQTIGGGHG